ncbi:uncharacterized protein [Mytilus edulis]|uniref:uncharacterized protein n=1 Tax=Mytilus edulis TaxID=6550 RepID=UPI0039EE75FB
MWDLCFKSDDNGCCQSFPDRGHETPDWFVQFLWALYAAYISIAITCIICPYCVLLNQRNIEGKECMTVLLIASCFSSAICLIMALRLYGFNFKSVESLEDHNLYTSFWLTVVCVVLFSFDGLMMTVITIKNGCCATRCRNAPKSTSDNVELTNMSSNNTNNIRYITKDLDINHCDVEQRRPWKAERQRYQKEDSTNYNLEEQRRRALDKSLGNYNDINDYNEEERRGWRGGKQGHQKDFKDNDVEERRRRNAERHENQKACFYGEGVYFATEPSYSSNDTYSVPDEHGDKFVYKCSVFVGRFGQGEKDLKEPPRDENNIIYDSAVDDVNDPKIHVMFRDNQTYPEYLIQFNRARY